MGNEETKKNVNPEIRFKRDDGSDYPDWNKSTLGDICAIKAGQQLDKKDTVKNGVYKHMNGGIEPSNYTNLYNTKANTISISEGGNSCGYINWNAEKFFSGAHNYTLQDISTLIDDKFLYQYLKRYQKNIMQLRVGSGLPNIQKGDLSKFNIDFPCLEEQQKIASCLSSYDKSIEEAKKYKQHLEETKKGVMQKIFNQEVRFKRDDGSDYEGWKQIVLSDVCEVMKAGGTPRSTCARYYDGDVNFISISDISNCNGKYISNTDKTITKEGLNESAAWLMPKNTLALSMYASYGKVIILDKEMACSQAIIGMILKPEYNVEYIYQALSNAQRLQRWDKYIQEGTQKNINAEIVRNFKLLIPCLEEQQKIAECLSEYDKAIETQSKIIENLELLKKGLMQKLF